eukprot:300507_1
MSEPDQTKEPFEFTDLKSTIESKLNTLREQHPLNSNEPQHPMSLNNTAHKPNRATRGRGKTRVKRGKGKYKCGGRGRANRIANDTRQFKQSVNTFVNNTEKKKWYYQQFATWYHKLPSHLQTKYDPPSIHPSGASNNDDNVDYGALLDEIHSDYRVKKPAFRDNNFKKNWHYMHYKVSAPTTKKRKLTTSNANDESENDDEMKKEQNLARDLVCAEQERQAVWKYYDETTSWYYTRYLYYASQVIKNHWDYVRREENQRHLNQRSKIHMAEYNEQELEAHLKIVPPDWYKKTGIEDKYWYQRYRLFSKYDEGIEMDKESWYSVTPEKIAINIAEKCKCNVIMDAMCGVGGNAIAFAQYCDFVIAIDIDPEKIRMAKHNAQIYGVQDKIQFIVADFFAIAKSFIANSLVDVVFLSPPWGGQFYQQKKFDITYLCDNGAMNGIQLFQIARLVTPNIAYFLPKNTNYRQLQSLANQG